MLTVALDAVTTAICNRNKACSPALALHFNFLVHTNYDLLIPLYNTKALWFV